MASFDSNLIENSEKWWYLVLGVLMALQTWELFEIIPATYLMSKNKKRGYVGAFIAGILGSIFSSPCATPALIALLAIAASKGSLAWSVLLLLLCSIGHGALAVAAGTSVGIVRKITASEGYGKWSIALKK